MAIPVRSSSPLPAPSASAARPSRLGAVVRGRQKTARRVFLYGDGGLGKTTLAASMVKPLFLDLNQGSAGFDVSRYTFDDAGRTKPATFDELLRAVEDVAQNGAPEVGTLVIDVLSDVEPLVWAEVIKRDGKAKSITDGNLGFGKGYEAAVDEWRRLAMALEQVWKAGIHVVLLDHSDVKKEKNPQGSDYGRGMPKIHPLASKFLHTWSDFTLFVEVETILVPDNADDRKMRKQFAQSDGSRILHARPAAEYLAKSRPELPDPIQLPREGGWQSVLRALIETRLAQIPETDAQKAREALVRAGQDTSKLEDLDAWCASRSSVTTAINAPADKAAS